MPTIGGPDYPITPNAVRIETRATWDGSFVETPELEFLGGGLRSAAHGSSSCEVLRRYGIIRQPYETELATVIPLDLNGTWIRAVFYDGTDDRIQFMGQIRNQVDHRGGNAVSTPTLTNWPNGDQIWTAYGGLEYLDRIDIYQSWWAVSYSGGGAPVEKKLDWIPPINQRDRLNTIVGNRTASLYTNGSEFDASYLYGGDQVWTFRQYIDYILARFVNALDGPKFELSGSLDFLEELEQNTRFDKSIFRGMQRGSINPGATMSAGSLLRLLINPQFGLDFIVLPNFDVVGNPDYYIRVFPLSGEAVTFEGVDLPENNDDVDIDPSADPEHSIGPPEIINSEEHKYDKIVVLGERIVVCTTLRSDQEDEDNSQTLVKKWTDSLESEYKTPTAPGSGSTSEEYDAYRKNEKFEAVYQVFGAPVDWDMHAGAAAPEVSDLGVPSTPYGADAAQFQNAVRETLPWLPLRKGYDYTVDPVESNNLDQFEPDYLPPIVLVYDEDLARYVGIEHYQISVHCVRNDWGIFVNPSPNHRLGKNHFEGGADSEDEPQFDWEKLIATIAFPSDKRFQISYTLDDEDKQSVKTIEVPGAELWYAVPGTITQLSPAGVPVQIHESNIILRNDSERLYAVMAGAIARYYAARRRCRTTVVEIMAYADLIGKMLNEYTSTVDGSTDTVEIQAPITAIEWSGTTSPRQTRIIAGLMI